MIQCCGDPKPPVSVSVVVHVTLNQRTFWSFLNILAFVTTYKTQFWMLRSLLRAPVHSLTQNSISHHYTSNAPQLACLFLSVVLLQVIRSAISSPLSVSEHAFCKGSTPSLQAWMGNFPDKPVQDCTHGFSSLSGGMWEQMMTVWYISLRDAFGGGRKKKTNLTSWQPTVAFVPPCLH